MNEDESRRRLSSISTIWTVLRQAHGGPTDEAAAAQQVLLQRYGGAIYRYLLRSVGDAQAADDLSQEFALCLVRGEFRRTDPQRGRFRDYVKVVLCHLVARYRKQQQKQPRAFPQEAPEPATLETPSEEMDHQFNENWRTELMVRAWTALARAHPDLHAVLRFRVDHAGMPSRQMAKHLGEQLGKPLSADGVRQALHRAREKFAEFLVEDVACSVDPPTREEVEHELRELNLLAHCQAVLPKRFPESG
jgi:RNA polymerase sigma-70 factor (ECF subfamily)